MKANGGLLPLSKAAQLLKTTEINVLMHVRKGLLEQVEKDGIWAITIKSFEEFVSKNGIKKSEGICTSSCPHAASCGSGCG
ncbi:MAG: hypothetical protein C0615_03495 [Desulfuromonas sp.]|nr:MAG: hypothetical protein C0615_03495 [Desulfuromonas sp.]